MKAIVKVEKGPGFQLREIPVPRLTEDQVLVRMEAAAICGSDLSLYRWDTSMSRVVTRLPRVPGHECAGRVVAVGSKVRGFSEGDVVAAETHVPCGSCWQCRNGRPHTCLSMGLFGYTMDGGMAEYAAVPQVAARKIGDGIPIELAALLEPMGIPLRAVLEARVRGRSVVVVGAGPIGLFAAALSRTEGAARTIVLETNSERLRYAREIGADVAVAPGEDPVTLIRDLTRDSEGPDVVIEASGNPSAIEQALRYSRIGATLFLIGQCESAVPFRPSPDVVKKELTIRGLYGREIWGTWEKAEEILRSGALDAKRIITHRFPLERQEEAFQLALSGAAAKVLFTFGA